MTRKNISSVPEWAIGGFLLLGMGLGALGGAGIAYALGAPESAVEYGCLGSAAGGNGGLISPLVYYTWK